MRTIAATLLLAFALAASAQAPVLAQAPDPVMDNYRAYRAALTAGDQARAETAAEAAWRASEARDGAGGHTGALAMNLVVARQANDHVAEALEPARRALEIAQSNTSSGVDPLAAGLLLGRSELATDASAAAGQARITTALTQASAGPVSEFAYPAAADLGRWALAHQHYDVARDAWAAAAVHAEGATVPVEYARGTALWGQGVALIFLNDDDGAARVLNDSVHALSVYAREPGAEALSPPQAAYAQSLAWLITIRSKQMSEHPSDAPPALDVPLAIGLTPGHRPCAVGGDTTPRPTYPPEAMQALGVGAVIIRVRSDASGAVTSTQVVASAPSAMFGDSVRRVIDGWHLQARADQPAGCSRQVDRLLVYRFGLRQQSVMLPF